MDSNTPLLLERSILQIISKNMEGQPGNLMRAAGHGLFRADMLSRQERTFHQFVMGGCGSHHHILSYFSLS